MTSDFRTVDARRDVRERRQHHAAACSTAIPSCSSTPSNRSSVPASWPTTSSSMFPAQVSLAGLRPRRDGGGRLPRHHRRGVQGARAHAAREQVPPRAVRLLRRRAVHAYRRLRRDDRADSRATMSPRSSAPPSTPGRTIGARPRSGSTSATARSSSSTPRRSSRELPAAHVLHVVRNPWSAYADTKKRPVPLSLDALPAGLDGEPVLRPPLPAPASRADAHRPPRGRDGRSGRRRCGPSATAPRRGGRANRSRTPSWNGTALEEVYPWGTIRRATPEANRATAAELSAASASEIRERARHYLEAFDYASFPLTMKRVLITGGTGFVGANLTRRLLARRI